MDRAQFRDWFSRIDELTAEPCRKVAAVLSDPPEGKASLAAVIALDAPLVSDAGRCHRSAGERVRGAAHIQTVNSRHGQIKGFLRRFRGIATKCLDNYLRWFHLVVLGRHPSPRACLAAASARTCLRFAN